jgi:DNA-binding MltR family transcriptional regulator
MSTASRKIIRRRRSWAELFRWIKQSTGEPRTPLEARYIALTGAAALERNIENAIRSKLQRLSKRHFEELFAENSPLGTFSAKIKIGFAMELYGLKTKTDLEHIREIRNIFAHAERPITFATKRIRDLCHNLHVPNQFPIDAKWQDLSYKRTAYSKFKLSVDVLTIEIGALSKRRVPRRKRRPHVNLP